MADIDPNARPDVPQPDPTMVAASPGPVETQSTNTSSGSTQTVATPDDRAAIQGQLDANNAAAQGQVDVGQAQADQANAVADVQGEDADLARQQAADAAADHQAYLDRIDTARKQAADAEDALKNHKYEDYWTKQGTGKTILHNIGKLLVGFGGNVAGQQAFNDATQNAIKEDFDHQRADYAQKLDLAKQKGADVNDLYSQWEREMGASKVKEAKAHEAVAAKALEVATRAGIPVDQAKNNVLVQQMLAGAQQKRLEAQFHFDRTNRFEKTKSDQIQDQKGAKGPTADQLKADAEVSDMTPDAQYLHDHPLSPDEMKVLTRRLNPPKSTGVGTAALNKIGDWLTPDLDPEGEKKVAAAQRLVGRLNPLVGEKRTPDSDLAVAISRLPTTDDKDTSKADRLMQTVRSQAWRTTNPAAFAKAATPAAAPATPLTIKANIAAPSKGALVRAKAVLDDPNASPAAKRAATLLIGAAR
jgi:hypothetical protein